MAEETATAEPTTEPTTADAAAPEPDIGESIAALRETLETRLPAPAEPAAASEDLLDRLVREAEEYRGDPEPAQEYGQQPQAGLVQPGEEEQAMEQLRQVFRQEAEGILNPVLAAQEQERRSAQLTDLQGRYPDLMKEEVVSDVFDRILPIAQATGDESLLTHPALVEMAYQASRAVAASATETPAEDAVGRGAVIETGAGGGAPETGLTEEEQIRQSLRQAAHSVKSPFG